MIQSHEQRIRKMLNLRPDDKPRDLPKDAPWPPPIPERIVRMVDDNEQLTRNQRGGSGMSVEIETTALVNVVVVARELDRMGQTGVAKPPAAPAADYATADKGIMALRKKVQDKTGKDFEELKQANREQLEAMLNG